MTLTFTGAEELFHECHHDDDKTEDFETECPCDQVIYIRSAAIFVCPTEETCKPMKSITGHSSAVKCNGSSTCLVTKDIVNQFCSHGDYTYIEVVYDCVNSGKRKFCLLTFVLKILSSLCINQSKSSPRC